jgi:hypothetical protein
MSVATRIAIQKKQFWDSLATNALSLGYKAESRFGSPIKWRWTVPQGPKTILVSPRKRSSHHLNL